MLGELKLRKSYVVVNLFRQMKRPCAESILVFLPHKEASHEQAEAAVELDGSFDELLQKRREAGQEAEAEGIVAAMNAADARPSGSSPRRLAKSRRRCPETAGGLPPRSVPKRRSRSEGCGEKIIALHARGSAGRGIKARPADQYSMDAGADFGGSVADEILLELQLRLEPPA